MGDYNNLPTWLPRKIDAAGLTPETLARKAKISRCQMYRYLTDDGRPTEQTMLRISRVLGVPFEEALSQYTPKTNGRPKGTTGPRELHVRR